MKHLTMDFPSDVSLTDVMRGELQKRLSNRYNLRHVSEDCGVAYHQVWRFNGGKPVSEEVINRLFKFLISS